MTGLTDWIKCKRTHERIGTNPAIKDGWCLCESADKCKIHPNMERVTDNRPWPRIYSTTLIDRFSMTPTEREALWAEYTEYWRGCGGATFPSDQGSNYNPRGWGKA